MAGTRTLAACLADAAKGVALPWAESLAVCAGREPIKPPLPITAVVSPGVNPRMIEQARSEMGPERWAQLSAEWDQ